MVFTINGTVHILFLNGLLSVQRKGEAERFSQIE